MEQKTAEEIVKENFKGLKDLIDDEELLIFYKKQIKICLIDFVKQQQEIAVEKDLEMCANLSKEMIYDRDNLTKEESKGLILRNFQVCYATSKQSILSLKSEILKELEK